MLNRNDWRWRALIILFVANLTACGFQLRGEGSKLIIPIEWKKLALISANPHDEFTRQVSMVFELAGVEWSSINSANYILTVKSSRLTKRMQSLNSQARPSEIELILTSNISVSEKKGDEILLETEMIVRRLINNNPLNATGVNEEIRLSTDEMQRQLAENLLRRISIFANSKNKN